MIKIPNEFNDIIEYIDEVIELWKWDFYNIKLEEKIDFLLADLYENHPNAKEIEPLEKLSGISSINVL